jgi:hypothetical protein
MQRIMRKTIYSLLLSAPILHPSSLLLADGGTVRSSQQQGNYQIAVLTMPTPLRAGPIDISVLVQNAGTHELVLDGQVGLKLTPRGHAGGSISQLATAEAATNKLFRAAHFKLPESGWWDVDVSIDGPLGEAGTRFEMQVAEPLPAWQAIWPWFAWPALVISLFVVHEIFHKPLMRWTHAAVAR